MRINCFYYLRTLLFLLIFLSLFAGSARANRRISLSQNQLFEDKEDVFLFPELALEYRNVLSLDLGGNAREGRLLFLGGWESLALGLAAYNSAAIAPYNYVFANPIAGDIVSYETFALYQGAVSPVPFPVSTIGSLWADAQPFSVVDGFISVPMGNGLFGARLGLGTRADIEFFEDHDNDSGIAETFVTLEAGLSGKGTVRYDTSLNVTLDFGNVQNETIPNPIDPYNLLASAVTYDEASGTLIRASLSGRGYFPFAEKIEVGVLGNLVFTNAALEKDPQGEDPETDEPYVEVTENIMGIAFFGGAGPVYRIAEDTTIGGYGLLGLAYATQDPNDTRNDDSWSDLMFYLPAVRVAADIGITNWFFLRGGLQYSFQIAMTSLDEYYQDEFGRAETIHKRDGSFSWSAGLGIEHEGFTLDGALQHALLTAGPSFIGGSSPGMFVVVSAGYHWL
ncbi:MAG: hypothetical protein JXA30_08480 [Deltaproteobacteria bacterium]|nr:hypothetical protein [Deltaproteobacteria bacterium]